MDLIENSVANPIDHWYYKHKFRFIKKEFKGVHNSPIHLADIGAGSALFSKQLIKEGLVDSVIAVDTGYPRDYFDEKEQITYARSSRYSESNFFLLTDVLEHIEEDKKFLCEIVSQASNGSTFIITVPALQCLWSGHDVYLKHYRRYSLEQLVHVVTSCGLEVDTVRYTYSTVFPLAFLQRKLAGQATSSQMKENSWFVGKILALLLIPDRFLPSLPFGVSLFLVAIKKT